MLSIVSRYIYFDTIFVSSRTQAKKKNRKRSRVLRSVSNPTAPQRNPSPISQCAIPPLSHSEGSMLKNPRSKHQLHRKNHPCENCRDNTCTEARANEKRKANGGPLQNLTNGTIPGSQDVKNQRLVKGDRKFSFRKFLKFQKRDSI